VSKVRITKTGGTGRQRFHIWPGWQTAHPAYVRLEVYNRYLCEVHIWPTPLILTILHKTRLTEFGRKALDRSEKPGRPKPSTFDFLGLTHICTRTRTGKFTIHVRTMRKRLRRSLKAMAGLLAFMLFFTSGLAQKVPEFGSVTIKQSRRAHDEPSGACRIG
jgi:hypothetical protein